MIAAVPGIEVAQKAGELVLHNETFRHHEN
jgi:hypothetical protein